MAADQGERNDESGRNNWREFAAIVLQLLVVFAILVHCLLQYVAPGRYVHIWELGRIYTLENVFLLCWALLVVSVFCWLGRLLKRGVVALSRAQGRLRACGTVWSNALRVVIFVLVFAAGWAAMHVGLVIVTCCDTDWRDFENLYTLGNLIRLQWFLAGMCVVGLYVRDASGAPPGWRGLWRGMRWLLLLGVIMLLHALIL